MQLRFASFVVINLRRDLHPQECAHAGRTKQKASRLEGLFAEPDQLYQPILKSSETASEFRATLIGCWCDAGPHN